MTNALAFSNNDIAVIAWAFDGRLPGCLGFAIHRGDVHAGTWTPLPAIARFSATQDHKSDTTEQAPVQKFWWKDLGARRGGLYRYRITPMGGKPGALTPLAGVAPLVTNPVAVTHDRGQFAAYFNRGILATQHVAQVLGTPSQQRLLRHIADPKDKLRLSLIGELEDALLSLLDEVDAHGGEIRAALYELNDPDGLEKRLQASDGEGSSRSRAVILGNEFVAANARTGEAANPDKDSDNRQHLKDAGVPVIDRILPSGHIPHNKFLVLKDNGTPKKVLTGSTNWTMNGLAAQTNNALVIDKAEIAEIYAAYWDELERDTGSAMRDEEGWQGPTLRAWTAANNAKMLSTPVELGGGATAQVFFSPNTKKNLARPPKEEPADVDYLSTLIAGAKQAVLFLAFEPGSPSILEAAAHALAADPKLFVRGALTSAKGAQNFKDALDSGDGGGPEGAGKRPTVAAIGDNAGDPKKPLPDFRVVPATAVDAHDAFGAWEAELNKAGFAIIHDKILVIDPFSDDCVVATGSHNLGYRASHNNDENMIVVRGHRALAEAYACHVLDVYDHYAWRWLLAQHPETFGRPLDDTDGWQDRYIRGGKIVSSELGFWLSATSNVEAHASKPASAGARGSGAGHATHVKKPTAAHKRPARTTP